jgi:Domain of unknown function (DUF4186)
MTMQTKPLAEKISCVAADCDSDLHCFRPKRGVSPEEIGCCRQCGIDLIDWEAIHRRDLSEIEALFAALPKELVRHHYWHVQIPEEVRLRAERYRPEVIADRTRRAIHSRLSEPAGIWDGTQTPAIGSDGRQIYFMGMHAVAACCRKCMEYWHGIPADRPLTAAEEDYFSTLVWEYVCRRLGWADRIGLIGR